MSNDNAKKSKCKWSAIRPVMLVAFAVAAWVIVPVPTKSTPEARMALNTWANSLSPAFARLGFNLRVGNDYPRCRVNEDELLVVRDVSCENRPEHLTFHFDNIVAACVLAWIIGLAYVLLYMRWGDFRSCAKAIGASVAGAVLVSVIFVLRGVLFGAIVATNRVEAIGWWDNPIRALMLAAALLPVILAFAGKKDEEKPQDHGTEEQR